MNYRKLLAPALLVAMGLGVALGSIAMAAPSEDAAANEASSREAKSKDAKPRESKAAGQPEMKLPPGWTEADMQACMLAGTPGKMHERLAKDVGKWEGKCSTYMPGASEPVKSDCTITIAPVMDGRYTRNEMSGEMPGMGPYNGFGINGFDNVSQKFVSTWIDNQSTGIMTGTGELSRDGKTMTWTYSYNCPINKKPTVLRQVEKETGPNTKTLEMFGADPKSGKEAKMMAIEMTRKQDTARAKR